MQAIVEMSDKRNFLCSFSHYLSRCIRKIANSDYWLRHIGSSIRPFIQLQQLGSHWTDIYEIRYLSIFLKSILKNSISLNSDKNNAYIT